MVMTSRKVASRKRRVSHKVSSPKRVSRKVSSPKVASRKRRVSRKLPVSGRI